MFGLQPKEKGKKKGVEKANSYQVPRVQGVETRGSGITQAKEKESEKYANMSKYTEHQAAGYMEMNRGATRESEPPRMFNDAVRAQHSRSGYSTNMIHETVPGQETRNQNVRSGARRPNPIQKTKNAELPKHNLTCRHGHVHAKTPKDTWCNQCKRDLYSDLSGDNKPGAAMMATFDALRGDPAYEAWLRGV